MKITGIFLTSSIRVSLFASYFDPYLVLVNVLPLTTFVLMLQQGSIGKILLCIQTQHMTGSMSSSIETVAEALVGEMDPAEKVGYDITFITVFQ